MFLASALDYQTVIALKMHVGRIWLFVALFMCVEGGAGSGKGKDHEVVHIAYPDILMVGAMKAGTTSLSNLMRSNPAICDYGEKEKHFFNGGEYSHNYEASVAKYLAEFKGCKKSQLTMDSTPGYSVEPNVVERMRETYTPDVLDAKKFLFLVREPVARHFSEYQMEVRLCIDVNEDLKLKNSIEWRLWRHERACENVMADFSSKKNDPAVFAKGYSKGAKILTFHQWCLSPHGRLELRRGHYKEVIDRYLHFVRQDQLFLVNFDKLIYETAEIMVGMSDYLNLQGPARWSNATSLPVPKKSATNVKEQAGLEFTAIECTTVSMLQKYFHIVNNGSVDVWINKLTLSPTAARGQSPFGAFKSPLLKCNQPKSNDTQTMKALYPSETWSFTEDVLASPHDGHHILGPAGTLTPLHKSKNLKPKGGWRKEVL